MIMLVKKYSYKFQINSKRKSKFSVFFKTKIFEFPMHNTQTFTIFLSKNNSLRHKLSFLKYN